MSVWCWGLTSHRTGRLSNDMWHVPWCHRQRQAPQADGWAVDWSDYMPFRSPPLVPIVLLQSLFCSQLAGRMWLQGVGNRLISLPMRFSCGTSSLVRSILNSSPEWSTSDWSKVSCMKICFISSCLTCYMSQEAQVISREAQVEKGRSCERGRRGK